MNFYLYNVEMPFSGTHLKYREMSSEEQLALSKANILLPLEDDFIEEYASILTEITSQCLKNPEQMKDLNIVEYIMFLIKLRIVSIGSDLQLEFDADTQEKNSIQKIKANIDLNLLLKKIYDISSILSKDNILNINNLKITLNWPNLSCENFFLKPNKEIKKTEKLLDSVCEYVEKISLDNTVINLKKFNHIEKLKIYEKLPALVRSRIQSHVLKTIQEFSSISLFDIKRLENWKFNLYNTNYQQILRLIFSFNLRNIYQEYYILASKKINPLYVNKLSISERKTYCSLVEEEIKLNEKQNQENSSPSMPSMGVTDEQFGSPDLQNLIREFEG